PLFGECLAEDSPPGSADPCDEQPSESPVRKACPYEGYAACGVARRAMKPWGASSNVDVAVLLFVELHQAMHGHVVVIDIARLWRWWFAHERDRRSVVLAVYDHDGEDVVALLPIP